MNHTEMIYWQYRTIVFEFQKDGLLGDRFIDDEEVEQTLNEQGRSGWELVSATMVQDGLLTLFKRPTRAGEILSDGEKHPAEERQPVEEKEPLTAPASSAPFRVPEPSARKADKDTVAPEAEDGEEFSAEELKRHEQEHIRRLEEQRRQTMEEEESFLVGEIRIS